MDSCRKHFFEHRALQGEYLHSGATMCDEKCDSKTPTRSKGTWLRSLITPAIVIAVGVLVLLLPALIYGRPFIYVDTWAFYGWGHDILAAIRHPWPSSGPFPTGRELWIIEDLPSGATTVDETYFRLLMPSMPFRSSHWAHCGWRR